MIIMDYSPFTTQATDDPPQVATPVVILPPSLEKAGNNGNNTPSVPGLEAALTKRREGRMSLFTESRAVTIIECIEDGMTLDETAKTVGVERKVIWTWMQLSPEFHHAVTCAREYQGHSYADQAVVILDEVVIDDKTDPKLAMAQLRKAEQRARIRTELAKAFNFRQYGNKQQNLNTNLNVEISPVDLSKYQ